MKKWNDSSLSLCERSLLHGLGPVQVFLAGLKGLYQKPDPPQQQETP